MNLKSFVVNKPRPLPLFVLADTSGSMRGEKIDQLNVAIEEMVRTLREDDDIRGKYQLCIITFGGQVDLMMPLVDIDNVQLPTLEASGNTPLGDAIDLLVDLVEDQEIVSSRAYTPTVILVSDALATDYDQNLSDYKLWEPLKRLHSAPRALKCQRMAMAIGLDADMRMLTAFVNNPNMPVMRAKDAAGINSFFRWVTISTMSRMNSINPNQITIPAPLSLDDDEVFL